MFAHRLALALRCTVAELLNRISAREFMRWMIFDNIEPFGEPRADLRMALQTSAMVNAWGAKTKPSDFMPKFRVRRKQTAREIECILKTMCKKAQR